MDANRLLSGPDRRAIGDLARRQGGCVARWQLTWLGLANASITDLRRRHGWDVLHAGSFALPGVVVDHRAQLWAAVLALADSRGPAIAERLTAEGRSPVEAVRAAATERTVVTGLSAAWLRGLRPGVPDMPHVLLDHAHHPRRDGLRITRGVVDASHHDELRGLLVARPHRLLWDTAWCHRRERGVVGAVHDIAIRADRSRQLPIDDVLAMVDEPQQFGLPTRRPVRLVEAAERLRPGFSHSATEALARDLCAEVAEGLGLVVEPRPLPISVDGRIIAEADIAIRRLRQDHEVDGPHHRLHAQVLRDRARDARLAEIDWEVCRHDVDDIRASPATFARTVREQVRRRLARAA